MADREPVAPGNLFEWRDSRSYSKRWRVTAKKAKRTKPRKSGDDKPAQGEIWAPVESFAELNRRSGQLALGWIITVVDLYFTSPKGPGSHPQATIVEGQVVRNPIRDLRAELNAQELRGKAEAVRTVHPEMALPALPNSVGSADQDVWLVGEWARAALACPLIAKEAKQQQHQKDEPPDFGTYEWSRIMPLTDIADRVLKDPAKTRKLKSVYGDRLVQIGGKGSKNWQMRLDGLAMNIRRELDRP